MQIGDKIKIRDIDSLMKKGILLQGAEGAVYGTPAFPKTPVQKRFFGQTVEIVLVRDKVVHVVANDGTRFIINKNYLV